MSLSDTAKNIKHNILNTDKSIMMHKYNIIKTWIDVLKSAYWHIISSVSVIYL